MPATSRAWLSDQTRPSARIRRRAAGWSVATALLAPPARGALRRAHHASRRVAQSLSAARAASEAYLSAAQRELRRSLVPDKPETAKNGLDAPLFKSFAVLFLGGLTTGAVYGLSASGSQTLCAGLCAATLWLLQLSRQSQAREAAALRRSLDELRSSLRVTHALLEASELQGAELLRSSTLPPEALETRARGREQSYDDDETRRVDAIAAS